MKTTTFALALLVLASTAFAQTEQMTSVQSESRSATSDDSTYRALLNTGKRLAPQALAVLEQQQAQIDPKCKLTKLTPDRVSVMSDVTFNLDGIPERGEWTTNYNAQACNKPVRRTVGFKGGEKGVEVFAAAPGDTLADAQLGQDAWRSFQVAAQRAEPACKTMILTNTQIVEEPSAKNGFWREAWIASVCGKQMGQIVSFYPTKRGTVFRMSLPDKPLPQSTAN